MIRLLLITVAITSMMVSIASASAQTFSERLSGPYKAFQTPTFDELFGESTSDLKLGDTGYTPRQRSTTSNANSNGSTITVDPSQGNTQRSSTDSDGSFDSKNPFDGLTSFELRDSLETISPSRLKDVLRSLSTGAIDAMVNGLDAVGANELLRKLQRSPEAVAEFIKNASGSALEKFLTWLDADKKLEFLESLTPEALGELLNKLSPAALEALLTGLTPEQRAELLQKLSPEDMKKLFDTLPLELQKEALENDLITMEMDTTASGSVADALLQLRPELRANMIDSMSANDLATMLAALEPEQLVDFVQSLSSAEMAQVLQKVSPTALATILANLPAEQLGDVLHSLPINELQRIIGALTPTQLEAMLTELTPSDAVALAQKIGPEQMATLLSTLSKEAQIRMVKSMASSSVSLLPYIADSWVQELWSSLTAEEQMAVFTALPPRGQWKLLQSLLDSQFNILFVELSIEELAAFVSQQADEQLVEFFMRANDVLLARSMMSIQGNQERVEYIQQLLAPYVRQSFVMSYISINAAWYVRTTIPKSTYNSLLLLHPEVFATHSDTLQFFTIEYDEAEFVYYYTPVGRYTRTIKDVPAKRGLWIR